MAAITRPPIAPPMPSISAAVQSPLQPSSDQVVVLYVMIAMAVIIFGFWNVPVIRNLINPLKLFTIGWHELCHIIVAILTGGRILKITIDPYVGGATIVEGGIPTVILSAGYIGSTLFGGVFILAGYTSLVAKIMSFVLGIGLLMPLALVRDKLTIVLTFMYEGLLIGFWFIDHACVSGLLTVEITRHFPAHRQALRWYCLFIGVMNILFVICMSDSIPLGWDLTRTGDVADDRFFHKTNDSDAAQFYILYPAIPTHVWALFWIMFQFGALAGFSLLGIFAFKMSQEEMNAQAAIFLPTR